MKKINFLLALAFILPLTSNVTAKCDTNFNTNVTRHGEVDPTGQGNTDLCIFSFSRECDKYDNSCSQEPEVLVNENGEAKSMPMGYKVNAWFSQLRVYSKKNNSYQIRYRDKASKSYCLTPAKEFE